MTVISKNLTSEDVRSLRRATDLCFDYSSSAGSPQIRAIWGGRGGPQPEQTYVVPVEGNRLHDYTGSSGDTVSCFYMAMSAQHMDHVRTFVHLAKKGDRLGFVWTRGNDSPVTRAAGVVVDLLDVQIVKPSGTVLTFRMATSVSLDNSARMVKRY